jgi:hypothetical protein
MAIIGYEYVPEHGWEPIGDTRPWCTDCGADGPLGCDCGMGWD